LSDLTALMEVSDNVSQETSDLVLLLNFALMRPEPVAQIVFAISAVEMLGQKQSWSADQKQLLKELVRRAEDSALGTAAERAEVVAAIQKGIHRVSLRQGVMRLLDALGLPHLKAAWEELYSERSKLVHGLAPRPGADYSPLAFKAVNLCGHIILTAVAREVPAAGAYIEKYYQVD
jgi:hypothetical protein